MNHVTWTIIPRHKKVMADMYTSDMGIDPVFLLCLWFFIHFYPFKSQWKLFGKIDLKKLVLFRRWKNIFRICTTIFLVQAEPSSKPSMYDLCRRKYSGIFLSQNFWWVLAAYCRRCLSAVLHNPFKTDNSDYDDIDGPTEEQLFLRQGMIELG